MADQETPTEIRTASEAKWDGFFASLAKALPHLLASVALGVACFNGCHASLKENQIDAHLRHTDSQVVNILTNSIE